MGHLALKSRHQNSWNGPHAGSKITLKFKRSSVKQKDKVIHRNGKIIILETNWSKEDVSILKKQKCKFIFIKLYKFECALKISWGKIISETEIQWNIFWESSAESWMKQIKWQEENHWNQIKD